MASDGGRTVFEDSHRADRLQRAGMNVKRGLIRLWMVFSILWAGLFLEISAPIWYTAAQLWLNKASDSASSNSCRRA